MTVVAQRAERVSTGATNLDVAAAHVDKPTLPIAELLRRGHAAMPGLDVEGVSLVNIGDANARATLYGVIEQRTLNQPGSVTLDAATGKLIDKVAPKTMTPGMVFMRGLQALHFGNFGHDAVKWLYFMLGLAGAFLFYSGNLLWIEARRKRRQVEQPRRTRVMAALLLALVYWRLARATLQRGRQGDPNSVWALH